jgi:hypothetical protein
MVLAGKRALWSYWNSSISHYQIAVIVASPTMKETTVDEFEINKGVSPSPPMAGENKTLVFAELYGEYNRDTRVQVVLGNRAVPVNGTKDTVMIDATKVPYRKPDRFVIQRVTKWDGPRYEPSVKPLAWEVRTMMKNGATWAKFDMDEPVRALAAQTRTSGTYIALLTDDHIQFRAARGTLFSSTPVPKNTAPELGFIKAGVVVFRTGRTIRVLGLRSKRRSVLAVADGQVHGLSSVRRPGDKGYRVAWIEERGEGRDRIRAINLPHLP